MKRTATTLVFLAGLGGGCVNTEGARPTPAGGYNTVSYGRVVPGVVGPGGEPIIAARGMAPTSGPTAQPSAGVVPAGAWRAAECGSYAHVPGAHAPLFGPHFSKFAPLPTSTGPIATESHHGILPVPGMGPPGAVAAVGALVPSMMPVGAVPTPAAALGRTSIKFTGPAGMTIAWQLADGRFSEQGLKAPAVYNFVQGQIYRLRLTNLGPDFVGDVFYPTLEVAPSTSKTMTFLAHASVPVTFTNEDFQQAKAGNLVVKVIYLPDRENQEFAVAGAEELVSTRLPPGADPIVEAQSRGTVLCIIRLGNIDLENKNSPAMNAPPASPLPSVAPLPPAATAQPPSGGATPKPANGPQASNQPSPPLAAVPAPLPPLPPKPPAAADMKPLAPATLPPLK